MDNPQGTITAITKAHSKSNSLRITIPTSIINQFGFKEGDKLSWRIEAENNKLIIKIKPVE